MTESQQADTDRHGLAHPYSIKRHGVTITNCDHEPVQTPGCIQDRGVLAVLRLSDLAILQISENSARWLGAAPQALLGQTVAAIVGASGEDQLRSLLADPRSADNPTYCFTLPSPDRAHSFDAIAHIGDGVAVLELEANTAAGKGATASSYSLVRDFVHGLQDCVSLDEFCAKLAEQVREVTGLDRVMVYRFHADAHGEVVAESRRADLDPWLGLHYPAADIPLPARRIFEKLWIRPVPDAAMPVVEMVPLVNPDTGRPLDMTHCALRGASVMYTEYLANMRVAASLTMSLKREGRLWGLIACHHYSPTALPYEKRAACEVLAQVASLLLKSAEDRGHTEYRSRIDAVHDELLRSAAESGDLARIADAEPGILSGISAGGFALRHGARWYRVGQTPDEPQLQALTQWIAAQSKGSSPGQPVYDCDSLASVYAAAESFADAASGVLATIMDGPGDNALLWFRPETVRVIRWGGNPDDKPTVPGPHGPRLTPRASFELFEQSVRHRALPWTPGEIEAVHRFRRLLAELIVRRTSLLEALNNELRLSNAELDAFAYVATHDLKEPLRGISKYAQLLLERADERADEDQDRLQRIKQLSARMDSLLESLLHLSVVGRTKLELAPTDLTATLTEALEMLAVRPDSPGLEIKVPRGLPVVHCDAIQMRACLQNLVDNALRFNTSEPRTTEIGFLEPHEPANRSDFPAGELQRRVYFVRDNGIGIEPRNFEDVFQLFRRLHAREEFGGGTGAGLALVKRIIERHGGQVWIRSTPGQGSTFFFTLQASDESPH